jgi:phospholipid/cholesterol/gamma-HCH transport system substrate-binding protein
METRANHVMIGAFAFIVTMLAFAFILWLSKVNLATQYAYYDVRFHGSVSGLPVGGEVRYNGVKVGTVEKIGFVPTEPDAVHVLVKIEQRKDFAVREDSQASLQFLGITGLTYVQIAGGSLGSPKLAIIDNPQGKVPVIIAQNSAISQVVDAIPVLLSKATTTFDRLNAILDKNNQEKINQIIANLADGSKEFGSAIKSINKLSNDTDAFMTGDGQTLVRQLTSAAKSISAAADLGDQVLTENRATINDFSEQGLAQFGTFVVEARQLVATLDRIAQHVESDPAGFVLRGAHAQEVPVRK